MKAPKTPFQEWAQQNPGKNFKDFLDSKKVGTQTLNKGYQFDSSGVLVPKGTKIDSSSNYRSEYRD